MVPKKTYEKLEKENFHLKKTAAKLKADSEKYQAIFNHNLNCIYEHDLAGNFLDANDAALSLMGYSRKEIPGLNLSSLIDADQLPVAFSAMEEIVKTGSQKRFTEYKVKKKDGTYAWVETESTLICQQGKPFAIHGVARDITQRKRAKRALTTSEKKYRELVQGINSVILRLDPQGNVMFINEFAKEFFGFTEKEIIGENVIGTIVPKTESSGRDLAAMIKDLGLHPERYINNENENMRKNGQRVWIAWTNKGVQDKAGNILEILCVGNDITGRKEAEKALRESEEKFRTLADSAPVAILIVAGEKLLYANPAFESISGFTKEEALAMRFWDLVHPDMQKLAKERGLARQQGEAVPHRYEVKALTKDGLAKWIDLSVASINYSGQTAILAIAYDITECKKAQGSLLAREQELKDKAHELEEMNAALRVLLKKREDDRIELEEKIQFNAKQLIEPYLDNLKKTRLSPRQASLHDIIKTNLDEIISPFASNFAATKYKLTPQEIKIASLIRQGKTTKNIAEIMGLSLRTIEFHRAKIRYKLGLKNKADSLQSHLMFLK
ncbi:MAG: PAS domain S-box protein [Deltaproteobacteria bacterium]|jgi:PAS domain S-box-containing protein|nr:PAS domain S-box protein [Deltaproteobacteria bacterium]